MKRKKVEIYYDTVIKYLNSIYVDSDPNINDYEIRKAIGTLDALCEELQKGEKLK